MQIGKEYCKSFLDIRNMNFFGKIFLKKCNSLVPSQQKHFLDKLVNEKSLDLGGVYMLYVAFYVNINIFF